MKRNAFVMHLHPGCEKEYKRRHDEIWPDLAAEIRASGVSNYSIYLDRKTNTLFAYQEIAGDAAGGEGVPGAAPNAIIKKWWHTMKDIMDTNADESPVCEELVEMFHLD
jgi:L-rhamnose mutarotase